MITDLWIENFKGIGKRQHIPLSPITLLFGANSAGKSTVLHALLYLREIVCKQNVNPTKPLEGEQTVNLGGFQNLLHKPVGAIVEGAADLMLGCRLTEARGPFGLDLSLPTQYAFFRNDTDCNAYRWVDPNIGDSYFGTPPDISASNYGFTWECAPDAEIYITIRGGTILGVKFVVGGLELLSTHCGCWINIWHPLATGSTKSENDQIASQKTERLSERLRTAVRTGRWAQRDIHTMAGLSITCASSVLTCPTPPKTIIVGHHDDTEQLSAEAWMRRPMFTLSSFLGALECNDEFLHELGKVNLDGAFVILDFSFFADQTEDTQKLPANITVGVRSDSQCRLEIAIELVRLACLMEATAGWFSLDSDPNGFPTFRSPSLQCSGIGNEFIGMGLLGPSRDQHEAFDRCRARIDQQLRTSLMQLDSDLRELCYVGPKRRTVPRNLNSDVMDEFSSWGDGLGAWRWMLQCSAEDLTRCSNWLHDKPTGLGTSFSLEREEIIEHPTSTLEAILEAERHGLGLSHFDEVQDDPDYRDWYSPRRFQRICLKEGDSRRRRHPQDVGEGITQVVPVIAAFVRASKVISGPGVLAIEQPELHLHPSLAAKVGDLALSMIDELSQSIALIETHSEHLILRILRRIRQTTDNELPQDGHIPPVKPDDVCVLWVDNLGDGTTIQRLRIDERGEFIDRWPKGFFSERAEELY